MKTIQKIFKVKNILISSLILLFCCIAAIFFTDPSVIKRPQSLDAEVLYNEMSFYPGSKDTAVLFLSSSSGDFSYKPLLRELLKNDYPVLVSHHLSSSQIDTEERCRLVEEESKLLENKSGIPAKNQIWIAAHDGADDLLDQIVLGNVSAKGAALISPSFAPGLIDDAIIQNGNYQNKSDWINTLSPDMLRQPLMLLTSNKDEISSPYQMTLLYNKFSSDEIIHLGGLYHAKKNGVSLSIIDSSYHSAILSHPETFLKVESFFKDLGEDVSFSAVPKLRILLLCLSCLFLTVFLVCVCLIAPQYAPEVSYGTVSSLRPVSKWRIFVVLGLSCITSLISAFPLWILAKHLPSPLIFCIAFVMLCFFGCIVLFSKLFSFPLTNSFKSVSLSGKHILYSILFLLTLVISLFAIFYSGTISTSELHLLPIVGSFVPTVLCIGILIRLDEQLQEAENSLPLQIGFYIILTITLFLGFVSAKLFLGNTAEFYLFLFSGLLLLHYLLAKGIFAFSGHALFAVLLSALSMSCFSTLFYVL